MFLYSSVSILTRLDVAGHFLWWDFDSFSHGVPNQVRPGHWHRPSLCHFMAVSMISCLLYDQG